MIRYSGWLRPDNISMPIAQLRENANVHFTDPYFAFG